MNPSWQDPYVAGISLTYDGTREEHLRHVVPLLDSIGLRATFFAYPPNLILHLPEWKQAASQGHEIGNAFLYGATDSDGLVPHWPIETLQIEFEESQELITGVDPNGGFAYPAVRTVWSSEGIPVVDEVVSKTIVKVNEELLSPFASQFAFARTPKDGFNKPAETDPRTVRSVAADGLDAESLCVIAHIGISQQAWTIFVFSGLTDSAFDTEAHEQFAKWLAEKRCSYDCAVSRNSSTIAPFRKRQN